MHFCPIASKTIFSGPYMDDDHDHDDDDDDYDDDHDEEESEESVMRMHPLACNQKR